MNGYIPSEPVLSGNFYSCPFSGESDEGTTSSLWENACNFGGFIDAYMDPKLREPEL